MEYYWWEEVCFDFCHWLANHWMAQETAPASPRCSSADRPGQTPCHLQSPVGTNPSQVQSHPKPQTFCQPHKISRTHQNPHHLAFWYSYLLEVRQWQNSLRLASQMRFQAVRAHSEPPLANRCRNFPVQNAKPATYKHRSTRAEQNDHLL